MTKPESKEDANKNFNYSCCFCSNLAYNAVMLYHVEVYMPEHAKAIVPRYHIGIIYSDHAKRAAQDDRYGKFDLPKVIKIADEHIVEICLRERKIVARMPLDNARDIVIVIKATENPVIWFAKTVWINLRSDKHKTLDRSRYSKR